jgi:hypothetical protein
MRVTVNQQSTNRVVWVEQGTSQVVSVGIQGPQGVNGPNTISNATDVDSSNLQNGSVLVYNTQTSKWTSTTNLDSQNLEAGEY